MNVLNTTTDPTYLDARFGIYRHFYIDTPYIEKKKHHTNKGCLDAIRFIIPVNSIINLSP